MHGLKGRGWTRTHPTTAAQRWRPTGETHRPYAARLPSNPVRTDPVPYPTLRTFVEETLGRRAGLAITQRESGRPS